MNLIGLFFDIESRNLVQAYGPGLLNASTQGVNSFVIFSGTIGPANIGVEIFGPSMIEERETTSLSACEEISTAKIQMKTIDGKAGVVLIEYTISKEGTSSGIPGVFVGVLYELTLKT